MIGTKQLINLVGALVLILVVAVGVILGVLPLYLNSTSTNAEADQVAQTNATYEVQVASLRRDEERFDEIEASLRTLRTEIPMRGDLDDVFELIASAAATAGVTITSASAGDAAPWTKRTGTEETAAAPAPPATTDPATSDPSTTEAAAETGAEPAPAPAPETDSLEKEVPFTIVVESVDTAATTRFIDALGAGPRLVAITHANLVESNAVFTLTVDALTFMRSEK